MARDYDLISAYNWEFVFTTGTEAICQQTDPMLWTSEDVQDLQTAAKFCKPCPLIEACLLEGLLNENAVGTWGGLTPNRLKRTRRNNPELIEQLRSRVVRTANHKALEAS